MKIKVSLYVFALLTLLGISKLATQAQSTNELAHAADRALAEGKEAALNVGFARVLGLRAERPLLLKRIQVAENGVTNMLNVVGDSTNTIILSERRQLVTTFYLTDRSGTLRRAVVNDGAIGVGGITNLPLSAAAAGFQKQKRLWLQQTAR